MIASEMRTLQKQSERNRFSLLQRGGCNAYCFGYNPRVWRKHLAIQFLGASARLLVTPVSLIYQVHGFFFLFLVQLNETKRLGKQVFIFLFLVLIKKKKKGRWVQKISLLSPKGFENLHVELPQSRWRS